MNKTLLLADDHTILRDGLRRIIELQPDLKVVGQAGSGKEAVAAARRLCPDVVVMDISMPDLNGVEATRRIMTADPKVRVVALSKYDERQFVLAMLRAGARAYVVKSASACELLRAINAVLAGNRYFSPPLADPASNSGSFSARGGSAYEVLTSREREITQLVAEGKNTREIARDLGIAQYTVNAHRRNLMHKVGARNVAELTRYAVREGLTPA